MLNVHMLNDGIEWCFCGVWSDGGGSCKMVRRGRKWGGSEGWTSRWRGFWVRSGMWLTWCAVVGSWSNYKRIRFVQWFVVQWRHFVCDRNCLQWRYRGYHHRRVAPAVILSLRERGRSARISWEMLLNRSARVLYSTLLLLR